MNHHTYTLNMMTMKPKFGSVRLDFKTVLALAEKKSTKYKGSYKKTKNTY